ncbi:MAG TPA: PIN domain-containing protein [Thermoanaerobaculia bacterium]|nr:PIN domain-containing protein [Thermoanaerobaculia bacterium]
MREYFVDAWYTIALIDRGDQHHHNAVRLAARLRDAIFVTHEAVFTEVLAFFAAVGPHSRSKAVTAVRNGLAQWTVVAFNRDLFARALALYAARPDKEYSLTDCMSMVVMRDRGIEHVLTNDHHFRQEGFEVLSE